MLDAVSKLATHSSLLRTIADDRSPWNAENDSAMQAQSSKRSKRSSISNARSRQAADSDRGVEAYVFQKRSDGKRFESSHFDADHRVFDRSVLESQLSARQHARRDARKSGEMKTVYGGALRDDAHFSAAGPQEPQIARTRDRRFDDVQCFRVDLFEMHALQSRVRIRADLIQCCSLA